jgi:monoamine oxidase
MLEAERVVVAVPFAMLHQIAFEPPLSEARWQAIGTLGRGQYTVVHLLIDKQAESLWSGKDPFPILTDGPLGVIYGEPEDSPSSQPLQVFSLLVYGTHAQAFHMVPRETKVREILQGLDALWPHFSDYVRASYVYTYHPAALPVWPPGRSPLDEPARLLREPELGLYLAGDYTLGAHSSAAVESGLRIADQIANELK